jgi:ribonuclease-3
MSQLPQFQTPDLLTQALTHTSFCKENPQVCLEDNQRLEFLGDAVLGFLVGALLYHLYPDLPEGELTRRRSVLVNQKGLAELANQLKLGDRLRLGRGVEKDQGRQNPSILSDAFEAVIGAYFLDSGIEAVQQFVEDLFRPLAESLGDQPGIVVDAKSQFQQWALAHLGNQNPQYRIVAESGPDHAKTFTAEVLVGDHVFGRGSDRSKRTAEKRAAEAALQAVGEHYTSA